MGGVMHEIFRCLTKVQCENVVGDVGEFSPSVQIREPNYGSMASVSQFTRHLVRHMSCITGVTSKIVLALMSCMQYTIGCMILFATGRYDGEKRRKHQLRNAVMSIADVIYLEKCLSCKQKAGQPASDRSLTVPCTQGHC